MSIELLAPAGNIEALDAAIGEGADAVYLGLKSFNARMRSSNFTKPQFEAACEQVHKKKKKIYVTVNTVITENETQKMYNFLSYLNSVQPDGIIVQDLGVVQMAKTFFPKLKLHASTQMNIASAKGANFLSKSGISRVVLARELSLNEIEQIKAQTTSELEVFVHGALCVSESGLCMFSSFLGGKSANRGMCTQACRRFYSAHTLSGSTGGYFFSPYDLQLIDFIPALAKAGVCSIKIEGRMKSAEYVGTVTSAYRYVLDNWEKEGKAACQTGKRILANDFARKKTTYRFTSQTGCNILNPDQAGGTGIFLGNIAEIRNFSTPSTNVKDKNGVQVKMHYVRLIDGDYIPEIGDSIRLHKKTDTLRESWKLQDIRIENGKVWLQVPADFGEDDSIYLLQTKKMTKRYPHVLPRKLNVSNIQQEGGALPDLVLTPNQLSAEKSCNKTEGKKNAVLSKTRQDIFPEGFYVQVSSIKDLHTVLSDKPVRAILNVNEDTIDALENASLGGAPLPFSKREIFLSFDPFMPESAQEKTELLINDLIGQGYTYFIVNNPAHIGMLKNKKVTITAGPYLYTFNRWAVKWLQENNIENFISPIENSQTNLEEVFAHNMRSSVLLPVFAYPALFRMRFTLPSNYDFLYFSDKQGGIFKAFSTPSASFVLPEKPFSITDRIPALLKKGFSRFLVDFSHTSIKRSEYRFIMNSCRNGNHIEDTARFNWKEGFYSAVKPLNSKPVLKEPS